MRFIYNFEMTGKIKPINAEEVANAINKLREIAYQRVSQNEFFQPPPKQKKIRRKSPNKPPQASFESITSKVIKERKAKLVAKKEPVEKGNFFQMWKRFRYPH